MASRRSNEEQAKKQHPEPSESSFPNGACNATCMSQSRRILEQQHQQAKQLRVVVESTGLDETSFHPVGFGPDSSAGISGRIQRNVPGLGQRWHGPLEAFHARYADDFELLAHTGAQ